MVRDLINYLGLGFHMKLIWGFCQGYDVERCLYFFSYFDPNATSMDESLKERAILAANFAIDKINKVEIY